MGAEIYDVFGMSQAGLMGAESDAHDGIHIWSDMYFVEVIDPDTGKQLPEGKAGTFCVTSLVTSNATPFLRWNSGDVVRYFEHGKTKNIHGELFPIIQHAHRTTGFFKLKGVNINHTDFEDFVFANPDITDFQGVISTAQSGIEQFTVRVEFRRGCDAAAVTKKFKTEIKNIFEINIDIDVLDTSTLARDFEKFLKAVRFVDNRE